MRVRTVTLYYDQACLADAMRPCGYKSAPPQRSAVHRTCSIVQQKWVYASGQPSHVAKLYINYETCCTSHAHTSRTLALVASSAKK